MWLRTGQDLHDDALFLAGEPASGSEYEDRVYDWLTVVQRSLISGGQFGPSVLHPVDWPWARAWPRGAIQLVQPFNQNGLSTIAPVTGASTMVVLPAPTTDLAGYRIQQDATAARHLIRASAGTTIALYEPWTGPDFSLAPISDWLAYPDTYDLPEDFIRGCSPLFVSANPQAFPAMGFPSIVDVIDPADMESMFPQSWPVGANVATPVVAARVSERKLRFSHFLNTPQNPLPVQIEFEYIRRPPFITAGAIPAVPLEHRRVLSYGCAYLILDDKDDSGAAAGAESLWQKFQAQYQAMLQEYGRSMQRMSTRFGRIMPSRGSGYHQVMMTDSGLPVFWW